MTKFKTAYAPHDRHQLICQDHSRCKQAFSPECDINQIMATYEKTGLLNHVNEHRGDYGDFVGYDDYHQSLNQIKAAEELFLSIPASVRAKFRNDPSEFLKFAQDPKNASEMVELGLAFTTTPKTPSEAPQPASTAKPKGATPAKASNPPSDGPDAPSNSD